LNKKLVSSHVRRYLKLEGADDQLLNYVSDVLGEMGYTDPDLGANKGRSTPAQLGFENLNLGIDDAELQRRIDSSTDNMPFIAKRKLTYTQIQTLTDSEKQQYADMRKHYISEQKQALHVADEDHSELLSLAGIKSKEETDRKSTQLPPKQLWGKSDTYEFLLTEAEALESVVKYLYDVAKQTYVFKLGPDLDKELQKDLEEMHDKVIIPMCKMSILKTNMVKYILDNVQDEKNRDTLAGWLQKSVHKFLDYGNHGTGEVDFIQTGEHIMKLGPDLMTIIRIAISREFTREQINDKTTFELVDRTNQMFIHCPNHMNIICSKCKNHTDFHQLVTKDVTLPSGKMVVETKKVKWNGDCGLEWNVPIITDEKRDVIAGDYFNKALNILLNDPVNRVIEKICDNVIIMPLKTPEQFLIEEYKKRGKDIKGIDFKNIKVINEKPTKIKETDIDPSQKSDVAFNIFYGRSNRTWAKAEYFSENA